MGDIDKALAYLPRAIRIAPKNCHFYYNRGRAYHRTERFDCVIKDFSCTIDLNPQFAPVYNHRGATYEAIGEIDKAWVDFDKVD